MKIREKRLATEEEIINDRHAIYPRWSSSPVSKDPM